MTQDNSSQENAGSRNGGGDLFNTAAGWVLFAAGLGLGLSILSGKYFHGDKPERPEKLGYVIEGAVEDTGGAAEVSIADALNAVPAADLVAAGEKAFAKCQSCHTVNAGGANGIGPNLYATMGKALGSHAGFAYSAELKAKGGTWDWDAMDAWLKNPKAYIPGTKMSFAGLSKVEDRAAIAAYLNAQGSNLPFPAAAAPAATPAADVAGESGPVEGADVAPEAAAGSQATTEPVPSNPGVAQ